jgi:hypothetical protein
MVDVLRKGQARDENRLDLNADRHEGPIYMFEALNSRSGTNMLLRAKNLTERRCVIGRSDPKDGRLVK